MDVELLYRVKRVKYNNKEKSSDYRCLSRSFNRDIFIS